MKIERLRGQPFVTQRQAKDETIAWLRWYKHSRLHSTPACGSPVRFAQHRLAAPAMQAHS